MGEHDHSFLQFRAVAAQHADQHVARLLHETAKYNQSTWKNGFLVILCQFDSWDGMQGTMR